MQLDPTRWLVALAGFIYDWIITREWLRIFACLTPLLLLSLLALASLWGKNLNRGVLAQRYMEMGDQEIADWEEAWAPAVAPKKVMYVSTASPDAKADNAAEPSEPEPTQVSQFAEMLFRRVQRLVPSDRSQYVLAATLMQRGAFEQGKRILSRIAPEDDGGYVPAHALLAQFYLIELQRKPQRTFEDAKPFMHHMAQAKDWDRIPREVLFAGSDLYSLKGDQTEALSLLARLAKRYPEENLTLAKRALALGNQRIFDQARAEAQEHFTSVLNQDPADVGARIQLADTYSLAGKLDDAEQVLREAPNQEEELVRALSELHLIRYRQSRSMKDGGLTVNIGYLDSALRTDPTNPRVAEEVARLVRLQGPRPGDELIDNLKARLAEGSATAATHAALAEVRLIRQEFELAIPHLEQVVYRMPTAAQYLNNLAFVLADLHPSRREEALGYAQRAIAASQLRPNPDFFDTLGFVLSKLERHKEAITALETAIELDRRRIDFRRRISQEYRQVGDESMAKLHEDVIERLLQEQAAKEQAAQEQAAQEQAAQEQASAGTSSPDAPAGSNDSSDTRESGEPRSDQVTGSEVEN